jgi:hypothetical protein
MKCTKDGKIGVKYGASGTCYTYTPGNKQSRANAIKKAMKQAIAIGKGKVPSD